MSRRSQMFAEGVQKFSWEINQVNDRYRARCMNFDVEGWGDTEQLALIDARQKITAAAERAEIGTDPKVEVKTG